jgi:hypothetical protein
MGNISSSHHYSVSVFVYNQQQIAIYEKYAAQKTG